MATRACIAMPKGKGWVGVYCHWDGYPTGLGNILWTLMEHRYGFDVQRAHQELILGNLEGWSSLNCFHSEWGAEGSVTQWDGKTKLTVDQDRARLMNATDLAGYCAALPVSYQGDELRGDPVTEPPLTSANVGKSWVEYVYVLREDCIDVWEMGKRLRRRGRWMYAHGMPADAREQEAA